ncbi:MAG: cyclodeaminase [Planctomycetota bacterium]|nr:MAG: cyclodeaminase [Planctomycetota bacterium]
MITHPPALPDLLYLSRADVESLDIRFTDVLDTVRQVFREKGLGQLDSPPKRGVSPSRDNSIRAMMAAIPSLSTAGVKWISGFPSNQARGWPTITAMVVLNDVETGLPSAILDGSWITATRTAASTLIAAQHMARRESSSVGLIACGLQGRSNLRALCSEFPVTHVKAFDIEREAAERFAEEQRAALGVEVEVVDTATDAAREVDMLVTSLPIERRPKPPLDIDVLAPGCFAALLDYNAAMTPAGMRQADKLIVDDAAQLRWFRSVGYFRGTPEPDGDLGKVVAGRQRGRESNEQRVIALNLGIGVLDIATASLIVKKARAEGRGTLLPL